MKLLLTNEEKEQFFYNALCNIGGTLSGYGLELDWNNDEYRKSREKLKNPCIEDVIMQMLKDGYSLKINDIEGDGENSKEITLQTVYDNIEKTPFDDLLAMQNEEDNGNTADAIIQSVAYGEIIFG